MRGMSFDWPPNDRWTRLPPLLADPPQGPLAYPPPALPLPPREPRAGPTAIPEVKRKVYFAFTYSDILRVNNVRQIGKIGPRESRNARTFFDRSLWERRSLKNDEGLKNLMRNGVKYSSAVCVLIGTDTWESRWVKYEISRAIVDGRGLFSVDINGLNHHVRRAPIWGTIRCTLWASTSIQTGYFISGKNASSSKTFTRAS